MTATKTTITILNDQDLAPVTGGLELPIAPVGTIDTTLEPQSTTNAEQQLINQITNPTSSNQSNN